MPPASRHSKPKTPGIKLGAPIVAAAALAGVAVAFVFLNGGSAAPRTSSYSTPVTSAGAHLTVDRVTTAIRSDVAVLQARRIRQARTAARRRQHLAAVRLARQQAAQRQAAQQQAAQQQAAQQAAAPPPPSPSPSPAPKPPSGAGMPPAHRSGSASATQKRAAATPGDQVTAAGRTSSRSAPGSTMAVRPASMALRALLPGSDLRQRHRRRRRVELDGLRRVLT